MGKFVLWDVTVMTMYSFHTGFMPFTFKMPLYLKDSLF